jgi:hypothetical protein
MYLAQFGHLALKDSVTGTGSSAVQRIEHAPGAFQRNLSFGVVNIAIFSRDTDRATAPAAAAPKAALFKH